MMNKYIKRIGIISGLVGMCIYNDFPLIGNNIRESEKIIRQENNFCIDFLKYKKESMINVKSEEIINLSSFRTNEWTENQIFENQKVCLRGYRGQFRNILFKNVTFDHINLEKTMIVDCEFNKCGIMDMRGDKQGFYFCKFADMTLNWHIMRLGDESSHIYKSNFTNVIWDSVVVSTHRQGRFDGCEFISNNFGSSLFENVTFRNCTFKDCDLTNARISGNIINCSFKNCNMKGLKISGGMSPWTYIMLYFNDVDLNKVFT